MRIKKLGNATPESIIALEKRIKFKLPDDYKQFLLEYNGGVSTADSFFVKSLNQEIPLHVLFGLGIDNEIELGSWFSEYKEDMQPYTLIIGDDMGSGLIVLLNSPKKQGVYYWDHTYYFSESSDERNIYKIADSFQDFLNNLVEPKESDGLDCV